MLKVAKTPASKAAVEEPAAKKAKTDEPKAEEAKVVEEKYQEPDAPKDSRPALKEQITFETADTTLNVVPTLGGKMLSCLTEGGMSFLLAGARANTAQKGGRYMFEAKAVQTMGGGKHTMRIGFSTSSSGLILGEDASSIYFDNEGSFVAAKKKTNVKNGRFTNQVVSVVLNLDSKSPNFNTVALYKDGVAASDAMPLPEDLKGQPLFPHVAFRSASVRVNFSVTLKDLPFKCRTLQTAAASDVTVAPSKAPKDGKYNVVLPVAFPDEGTFDWLDGYLKKNPQYVELSDRKIMQWAQVSGHHPKGNSKASNDKPQANFGVRELDDMSVRKVLSAVAPTIPRNYLIMEVKSNLIAAERQEVIKKFNYPCYKTSARVVMGKPTGEFKTMVQDKILKEKQAKADAAWKAKKAAATHKKAAALRVKEAQKKKKEMEKKRAADKKKKEDEEKKAKGEEVEEEQAEEEQQEEAEDSKEASDEETEPPVVELSEEEKSVSFLPKQTPDLTEQVMSSSFGKFTTPKEDEGFGDIFYEWSKADKADSYLKDWVMKKKLTTRIDNIKPGQVFRQKKDEFAKLTKEWKDKLAAWTAVGSKKSVVKDAEDGDDIDIFSVTDVNDTGKGVPLCENFTFEDWKLMTLRFELCWLVLSFKVDCDDADRTGIPKDHLQFYFSKYYSKSITPKEYGLASAEDVLSLMKDTVTIKDGVVVSQLSDDLDNLDIFLKLTEESRRERQRRLDAGDETARLKFVLPAQSKPAEPKVVAKPEAKPAAKPVTTAGTPAPKVAAKGKGKK